jgi:23S rRNA pseudouridine1911/1915/1917 synthase
MIEDGHHTFETLHGRVFSGASCTGQYYIKSYMVGNNCSLLGGNDAIWAFADLSLRTPCTAGEGALGVMATRMMANRLMDMSACGMGEEGVCGSRLVFTVAAAEAGTRLDRFLAGNVAAAGETLSRTRLQTLIGAGRVAVDAAAATDAGGKVREGQRISLDIPAALPAEPQGESLPLAVVYEDEHLIVIDKPAGLVVHPAAGHPAGTLVNALIAHCGESLSGIGGVRRPGIVHRLDKNTSGLLVAAKSDAAHSGLTALFADHGHSLPLRREYLAFLWAAPDRAAGAVDAPLGRHATSRQKQAVVRAERGRWAVTHWRRLESFGSDRDGAPLASLVACRLETGRTHQIRVHMAHIGHPVLGDPVYATGFKTKAAALPAGPREAVESLGRQALHAAILGFTHPVTGHELCFESPLPVDLAHLHAHLKQA